MTTVTRAALVLIVVMTAASAFAHAGHMHTYMGTVTAVHIGHEFVMKTTDGKGVAIRTSAATKFTFNDDKPARENDLAVGARVVVKMSQDGKTANIVKMSARK